MDSEREREIEARLKAATPGPWRVGSPRFRCLQLHDGREFNHGRGKCTYTYQEWDKDYTTVYRDLGLQIGDPEPVHLMESMVAGTWDYEDGGIRRPEDAVFIAHAPEDIGYLLAETRRLRAALAAEREHNVGHLVTAMEGSPQLAGGPARYWRERIAALDAALDGRE